MRDFIKSKSYFDEFIIQDTGRVERFETKIKSGEVKEDRILPVKYKLIQIKTGIIIAKYSRGDSIELLRNEFESLIDLFVEAWNSESYEDNLRFASLAYLLNINTNLKDRIREKLKGTQYYDYLIDFVLVGLESDIDTNKISFLRQYKKLVQFIDDGNKDTFSKYLHGWYRSHFHSSWYDTHKNEDYKLYFGYWCFEAGAVAKRMGLKDDDLQKEQYYPYDMVHFAE